MLIPEIVDLVKLIPNGASVIAVIVVVILFLKQQDKMNEMLQAVTEKFNEQSTVSQKLYQDQLGNLSQQYFVNQKSFQDQIQLLIDSHMKASQQATTTLKGVEAKVSNIQERLNKV
jgi:hypothetical protein